MTKYRMKQKNALFYIRLLNHALSEPHERYRAVKISRKKIEHKKFLFEWHHFFWLRTLSPVSFLSLFLLNSFSLSQMTYFLNGPSFFYNGGRYHIETSPFICSAMYWFLHDRDLRHEKYKAKLWLFWSQKVTALNLK